jgi:hypothetical protein
MTPLPLPGFSRAVMIPKAGPMRRKLGATCPRQWETHPKAGSGRHAAGAYRANRSSCCLAQPRDRGQPESVSHMLLYSSAVANANQVPESG